MAGFHLMHGYMLELKISDIFRFLGHGVRESAGVYVPLRAFILVFNECLNYGTLTRSAENKCQKVSKFSSMRNI